MNGNITFHVWNEEDRCEESLNAFLSDETNATTFDHWSRDFGVVVEWHARKTDPGDDTTLAERDEYTLYYIRRAMPSTADESKLAAIEARRVYAGYTLYFHSILEEVDLFERCPCMSGLTADAGYIPCPECEDGSLGVVPCPEHLEDDEYECPGCGDVGEIECWECRGAGQVPCIECGGK